MPRQAFVEKRIVRADQLDDATVLADLAFDEQLGLLLKGLAQVLVKFREQVGVGHKAAEVAQLQPLTGEVFDQRLRPAVGEHAPNLAFEDGRILQSSATRQIQ